MMAAEIERKIAVGHKAMGESHLIAGRHMSAAFSLRRALRHYERATTAGNGALDNTKILADINSGKGEIRTSLSILYEAHGKKEKADKLAQEANEDFGRAKETKRP